MTEGTRAPEALVPRLTAWLKEEVEGAGVAGVLFGLSGGLDSAVVCSLAERAVDARNCLGLIMPIGSAGRDGELARKVADHFQVPSVEVDLNTPFSSMHDTLAEAGAAVAAQRGREGADRLAVSNLKPRLRMTALYYYANLLDYLVVGTSNKAELTMGYYTKYGDGGADLLPLGDLTKEEVRGVARMLDVPEEIVERPPSAGLWEGQTDEEEMGVSYAHLDRFLLEGTSGDEEADFRIGRRYRASAHKRKMPPIGLS